MLSLWSCIYFIWLLSHVVFNFISCFKETSTTEGIFHMTSNSSLVFFSGVISCFVALIGHSLLNHAFFTLIILFIRCSACFFIRSNGAIDISVHQGFLSKNILHYFFRMESQNYRTEIHRCFWGISPNCCMKEWNTKISIFVRWLLLTYLKRCTLLPRQPLVVDKLEWKINIFHLGGGVFSETIIRSF